MYELLIIGDVHFGKQCTVPQFVEYQVNEFKRAVSYADYNKINNIVVLGDFFDNRSNIYLETLDIVTKLVNDITKNTNITIDLICGNHDTFYKNISDLTSIGTIFANDSRVNTYESKPFIKTFDNGKELLYIPWINKQNHDDTIVKIKESQSDFCLGHFEINGFNMNNSTVCKSEYNHSLFKHFKQVLSGHFHTSSKKGNILYTGSLCQLDWSDYGLYKGFYVLNQSGKLDFIKSDNEIYKKFIISEKTKIDSFKDVKDCFLKVYINRKLNKKENILLNDILINNISYEIIDNTILEEVEEVEIDLDDNFKGIVTSCVEVQDIDESFKPEITDLLVELRQEMHLEEKK